MSGRPAMASGASRRPAREGNRHTGWRDRDESQSFRCHCAPWVEGGVTGESCPPSVPNGDGGQQIILSSPPRELPGPPTRSPARSRQSLGRTRAGLPKLTLRRCTPRVPPTQHLQDGGGALEETPTRGVGARAGSSWWREMWRASDEGEVRGLPMAGHAE